MYLSKISSNFSFFNNEISTYLKNISPFLTTYYYYTQKNLILSNSFFLQILERSPDLPPPHLRESGIDFNHEPDDVKHSYSNIRGQCIPFAVDFCKELPYNYTIFPNGLGHVSLEETNYVLESFK